METVAINMDNDTGEEEDNFVNSDFYFNIISSRSTNESCNLYILMSFRV